jgi:hypothetical protein
MLCLIQLTIVGHHWSMCIVHGVGWVVVRRCEDLALSLFVRSLYNIPSILFRRDVLYTCVGRLHHTIPCLYLCAEAQNKRPFWFWRAASPPARTKKKGFSGRFRLPEPLQSDKMRLPYIHVVKVLDYEIN